MLRNEPGSRRQRRGFGRLRQERSGRWSAAYVGPDGVLYRHSTTFSTEDAARGWLADERKLIDLDGWTAPTERDKRKRAKGQTFRQYATHWLDTRLTRKGEKLKPRTLAEYRRYLLHHIYPAFGDLPVKSVTESRVREWWDEDMASVARNERAHAYQLLRAIATSAVKDRLIGTNPCTIEGAGIVHRSHHIRVASLDELTTLTEAMPDKLQLAVILGAWCALRYGEIAELRRRDIDVTMGVVKVSRGVTWPDGVPTVGTPKSDPGTREVVIPPHLLPIVQRHLDEFAAPGRDGLLLPSASGQHLHPRTFGKRFDAAREAAGRPDLHFHDLRHTGAVLAAQSGATIADLMARLGHSTPRMAMHYQHTVAGRDAQIAAKMSKRAKSGKKSGHGKRS